LQKLKAISKEKNRRRVRQGKHLKRTHFQKIKRNLIFKMDFPWISKSMQPQMFFVESLKSVFVVVFIELLPRCRARMSQENRRSTV
jgi:hypothetical protein